MYSNDSIYYAKFSLNQLTKEIQISHSGIQYLTNKSRFQQLDSKTIRLPFNKLIGLLNELINFYQNKGYPFAKIHLENIRKERETIKSDLVVEKGLIRTLDAIVIKGYDNFPVSFVKHHLDLDKKTNFNKMKIQEISKSMLQIPFVSEIKRPEVLFTKDSTALYLYLKKVKSNSFDGLVGFSTSQDDTNLNVNGYLDLNIQNALNYGESLQLNWLSDGKQSQSLKLTIRAPYILNSPLTSIYDFNIYKQDTTFLNISNHISLDYQLKNTQRIGFIVTSQKSNKTSNFTIGDYKDYTSLFYGISYHYIRPNNHPVFTNKIYLKSQASQGKRNETIQNKISNYFSVLFNLSKNKNIVIKNNSEILFSKDYYNNELFRLGGSNTIRGFAENSLLAKSYSYMTIEYNYITKNSSYVSALSDLGILKEPSVASLIKTYSFGIGYTTKTPIGNLGIQYFIGNTNKSPFSYNNSKLHFKLLQNF